MLLRRSALLAAAVLLALALPAATTQAASWTTTSSNWAGYAVSKPGTRFGRVSATWVAPAVSCGTGGRRYSAVWVGLGGLHTTSRALEQIGTEADCAGGKGYYSVWYELVPDAPVQLKLTVKPGDTISASVTVSGHAVKLFVANRTRGSSFSTQLQAAQVDVSSAEWIVEAPSACADNGGCQGLPLAAFAPTTFANVSATSATGHSGTVSDPAWSNVAITLSPHRRARDLRFGPDLASGDATPSGLSPGGDAFTVTLQPASS
ncbi:MAG: G1 family glutamic endopeptidase [Solirubrobacteraceae bacterium]